MDSKGRAESSATGISQQPAKPARRRPGRPTLSNEELLDIALDLFLEHGFERTSIDAICAAAGMAKRTVYARYQDKTSLFKAALNRAIKDWIVPVERLRAAESESLEESLLNIGQILVANILSPAGLRLLRLTNAESGRWPEIGAFNVKQGTEPTAAYLADLFRRRIANGATMPDAEAAALAFMHLVIGGPANASAWGVVLDKKAIDHQTRYCVHLFLYGLLPQHNQGGGAVDYENQQLKKLLAESVEQLDLLRGRLAQAAKD